MKIKFRIWSKKENKYTSVCNSGLWFVPDNGQLYYSNGGLNVTDRYVTELFTGLLDRNGVEIYEGDIVSDGGVQSSHYISGVHLVQYTEGAFFPFAVPGWEGTMSVGKCEVVGNIHQNPELLK